MPLSGQTISRSHLPSLLLLPFPPVPATRPALNAAYRTPLTTALSRLKDAATAQTLIVAVACPLLARPGPRQKRAFSWPQVQSLLAGLYTIVSVVCAELRLPAYMNAGPGSVDVRVVMVDHDKTRHYPDDFPPASEANSSNNTTVVDLAAFASAYHPWNCIFSADSEAGHELRALYLKLAEKRQTLLPEQLLTVKAGRTLNIAPPEGRPPPTRLTPSYATVCLGGTFDHLHPGHKLLLTAGAYLLDIPASDSSTTCRYIIGITGDELLKNKKNADILESWSDRARNVIVFVSSILELSVRGWPVAGAPIIDEKEGNFSAVFRRGTVAVQCVTIQDPFGPTITEEDMDVLVVSAETRSGGQAVNDKRAERGWKALDLFEVDVLDVTEISDTPASVDKFSHKISSTFIRRQIAEAAVSH